jgi:acetoin utilization deacetylase AcuC-like enzyme
MSEISHRTRSRLLLDPAALAYELSPYHPRQTRRIEALLDLLETSGVWRHDDDLTRLDGRAATPDELCLIHSSDYVAAVQRLSTPENAVTREEDCRERAQLALHYGFDERDTPVVPGMHEVSARIAGGTLVALSAVLGLPEGTLYQRR